MSQNPDISFIVVNFNGIKHTRELLLSMEEFLDEVSYEVIVVDNGSINNESILLAKEFPNVKNIRSNNNLGFAGGNNLGIKESLGRFILLINNDTLLIDNSVNELAKMLDSDSSIAAVSPKIYFLSPPQTIQYAGFTELSKITLRNKTIGYNQKDVGQYNTPTQTAFLHGAAMMVRRDVVEQIGLMPEIYFLYYEELDWCTKMKNEGYKLMYQPAAIIIHKESKSTGVDSPLKRYYLSRNRLLFAKRNRRGAVRVLAILYQLVVVNPKMGIISLFRGRVDLFSATLRGVIDYFRLKL